MNNICMTTSAKTTMSEGTDGRFNSRNEGGGVLTKGKRKGYQSDYLVSASVGGT